MNELTPCHRTLICYDMEVEKYNDTIQCICGFNCIETPDDITILDAFIFPTLRDFMTYLSKLFGTVVLIAHNGYGYDHLFILEYLCTYKEVFSEFADLRLLQVGWGRANLIFRDSKSYIPGKLADIAESLLNDKKLECDLDNAPIEELIIYCRQDALLVVKIMQYVQVNLLKNNDLLAQPTLYFGQADIAYRIINANIDCFTLTLHDSIHAILSQCYYGGRVYSPIYGMRVKRPLCVIDIRSMYPASLCRPYPCGSIYFSTEEVVGKLGIYYIRARRPMPSCIKQTKAIVPVRSKDSILFASHGQLMGYYCSPDIEAMRLDGWDVEVLHGLVWTDTTLALRDKYNALYNERKKYPKDHPKNYAMKIILNSSYGKFCQIKSSNDSRPKYVGWFCLAYTRLQLYHLMKLSKDSIVYYGDTDCIIVSQDVLPVDKDMLRNELSLLPDDITVDVESMHNELIVLGKKSYALLDKNKVRVKGIPRASVDNVIAGWQGATKVAYLSKGSSAIKMTSKGTLAVDAHNLVDKERTLKVNIPKEMIQCNNCKLWHTCEINMHA